MVKNKKQCKVEIGWTTPRRIYFTATGTGGKEYEVIFDKHKKIWRCMCKGYVYTQRCYHIKSAEKITGSREIK